MQDDVIIYLMYAIIYVVFSGVLLFAGKHAFTQLYDFLPTAIPYLRKFFDAGQPGALVIEQVLHVDPAQADKLAEVVADALEKFKAEQGAQPQA